MAQPSYDTSTPSSPTNIEDLRLKWTGVITPTFKDEGGYGVEIKPGRTTPIIDPIERGYTEEPMVVTPTLPVVPTTETKGLEEIAQTPLSVPTDSKTETVSTFLLPNYNSQTFNAVAYLRDSTLSEEAKRSADKRFSDYIAKGRLVPISGLPAVEIETETASTFLLPDYNSQTFKVANSFRTSSEEAKRIADEKFAAYFGASTDEQATSTSSSTATSLESTVTAVQPVTYKGKGFTLSLDSGVTFNSALQGIDVEAGLRYDSENFGFGVKAGIGGFGEKKLVESYEGIADAITGRKAVGTITTKDLLRLKFGGEVKVKVYGDNTGRTINLLGEAGIVYTPTSEETIEQIIGRNGNVLKENQYSLAGNKLGYSAGLGVEFGNPEKVTLRVLAGSEFGKEMKPYAKLGLGFPLSRK